MKVLLSAYACEPNKGSEPGVGWHWAIEIARLGHEVHVLTRANNRTVIDAAGAAGELPRTLYFHYYDLKPWQRFWKRNGRGVYLYYYLWQVGAARIAEDLHRTERFDLVHHLTFGSIKLPSFMGRLGIPFILGPLGGGETAPWELRRGYSVRGMMVDGLRDLARRAARLDPQVRRNQREATVIALRTAANLDLVHPDQRYKVVYVSDVGAPSPVPERTTSARGALSVVYVGRFLHWKGLHLALQALALLAARSLDVRLTLVGRGPEEATLRRIADRLKLGDRVQWVPWLSQAALETEYDRHDVFLFPSLHESGGSVVLEAMSHRLPVVCLDLGGPGMLVTEASGIKIEATSVSASDVIARLADALAAFHLDRDRLRRLSQSAAKEAERQSWGATVERLFGSIDLRAGRAQRE